MWIRSQDRTGLFMSYGICIDEFDGEFVISDNGGFGRCASYSTKEKALKVLDEIHGILDANELDISDLRVVFEMPADEDVEV